MNTAQSQIKPFYLDLTENEIDAIQAEMGNILRSGQLILGKHTEAFEAEFAKYSGCKYAVSLNTATSVLELLCVLKGARGKKIAVPSNTNFASVAAIIRANATPVYMDMNPETFQTDLDILKYTVDKHNISGVMAVHIGGVISPDFLAIADFCISRDIFLIEDCAHAHGSRLEGKYAGTFGQGGAFSFFPTKVMTTMEGGMLVTDNQDDADSAKSFRNQGKRHAAFGGLHYDLGSSWRLTEIAAYIGLVQLAKLDEMVNRRQRAASIVAKRLRKFGISFCETSHMDQASQYKFIIRLPDELSTEEVKEKLKRSGVICGGGVYEVPCHQQPVFKDVTYEQTDLEYTETWCPRHICPPITSGTSEGDARQISDALVEVLVKDPAHT